MSFLSKTAGTLSLGSALYDIHKTAVVYSNQELAKTQANLVVSNSINSQRSDTFSYKDKEKKNWINKRKILSSPSEVFGKIKGYFKGVIKTAPRYFPNFVLGIAALSTKSPLISKISTIGLALVEGYDFVVNSLGIFQKNDHLKL